MADMYMAIATLVMLTFFSVRGAGTYSIDYKEIFKEESGMDHHHVHHA